MSIDSENTQFRVVINHEEQYSLWPDYKAIPDGWKSVGVEGNKQTCLDYIEATWTDMRPLSLRKAMA
jgi:MbtH protein